MSAHEVTTPRTVYVPAAQVAKLVRKDLKASFPGVKFSVRTSSGGTLDITWTDGPTAPAVDKVTHPYAGKRFDGMWDLEYHAVPWYCPEHGARVAETYGHSFASEARAGHGNGPVDSRCCHRSELLHSLVGYVFTHRKLSPEFRTELEAAVAAEWGVDYDGNRNVGAPGGAFIYMSDLVYRLSQKTGR